MTDLFMLAWLSAEEEGIGGERGHSTAQAVGGLSQAAAVMR